MGKLQMTKRANGSLLYSVNIPLEVIERIGWQKGQEIDFEIQGPNEAQFLILSKGEKLEKEEENFS